MGFKIAEAEANAISFETGFTLLAETPSIYPAWKSLVTSLAIIGKQVHDARLVAVCHVYDVSHVLTFDLAHFVRMAAVGPGLIVVHPSTV